ncbi:MAG: type II toxin-antitoxin system HicB family antitoxin [Alphaproteobacteria bacterium]|nr:type II toxin-antitoxin system HicB family antitoxin [Alphaproteobacteria bacterium]MBV9372962.1 type II toxin-antitoxin system HicB family antitoxin [Alphaproteobacteria bacterium]MBV9901329.1 type II toxin-antitoxin system HicB family antitoxin [Alphaproteobacteria bacterium]
MMSRVLPSGRAFSVSLVSDGFGGYFVLVPDVPEAFTFAATAEEALARARTSLEHALEERLLRGEPLPEAGEERGEHSLIVDFDAAGAPHVRVSADPPSKPPVRRRLFSRRRTRLPRG